LLQRVRQHDHAIFATFGLAHDDGVAVKIHILDPKADALHQAHACSLGSNQAM
jgi:hypothetical protein